jgi:hypothetical protein
MDISSHYRSKAGRVHRALTGDLEYRAENKWRPNVKIWTDYVAVVKNSAMLAMENEGKLK